MRAADVARVDLKVHPLALELSGKTAPRSGLEGKFSVFHSAAVALIDGAGGEAQYADARVNAAEFVALRGKAHAVVDAGLALEAAPVSIRLGIGVRHEMHVEHCVGSQRRPMTDAQIDDKFRVRCEPVRTGAWRRVRRVRACPAAPP